MQSRALTEDEISAFKWRHPSLLYYSLNPFAVFPPEGIYEEDETLGGFVLVFKMQDGSFIYALTDSDPTAADPSAIQYVIDQTIEAVKQNAEKVLPAVGYSVSTILAVAAVAFFFMYVAPTMKRN